MALVQQRAGHPLGFMNPTIYAHAGSAAYHDVVPPASPLGVVRANYVNSVDATNGYAYFLRSFNDQFELPYVTVAYRMRGPLGLAAVVGREPLPTRARVYPSLKGLRRLELAARFLEKSSGFRLLRQEGGGSEFEKLREYQPDDDYRHIDWKATARRQRPVTRKFEAESLCISASSKKARASSPI